MTFLLLESSGVEQDVRILFKSANGKLKGSNRAPGKRCQRHLVLAGAQ